MTSTAVTGLYDQLSATGKESVVDYIRYLIDRENRQKTEQAERTFQEMDALLDENTGWESEEAMIKDLADFRRANMSGV